MRSLLVLLAAGLVLSLAAVFGVQWSVVRSAIDAAMRDYIAWQLAQDADELLGALAIGDEGHAGLAVAHLDPSFVDRASGRYFEVVVGDAVLRSPSLGGDSLPVAPAAPGERRVEEVPGPHDERLLVSTSGYDRSGTRVRIAAAADLRPVRAKFGTLLARYTQWSLALFALLVILQLGIVALALAPLLRMKEDVKRLEDGEITQLRESVPLEVLPLVREVNRLLALLARRLQRSRESLGNLAHALKGPLTVLTQVAADEKLGAHPELARELAEQVEVLRARIDAELQRARIAGGTPGISLQVAPQIQALLGTLRRLYGERRLTLEARIEPGTRFPGDRQDLLELCGNLLDNACKWARSRVLVRAAGRDGLSISVEDDGPGCSPEDLERIAQRGVRLDEATEGHGLGLAIARGIAASYGGEIRFGRSQELGGFQASVILPAA